MKKIYLIIRVLTVAPILACVTLVVLWKNQPELFFVDGTFPLMLGMLGILPLLAYPVQKHIPKFEHQGRKGQRTLAMIFAVAGYILCAAGLAILYAPAELWLICLVYLISGAVLLLLNKGLHIHASGHACGVAGPIALLCVFKLYGAAVIGGIAAILACAASIGIRRHTLPQFIGGFLIPIVVCLSILLSIPIS